MTMTTLPTTRSSTNRSKTDRSSTSWPPKACSTLLATCLFLTVAWAAAPAAAGEPCVPDETTLCFLDDRFAVTVTWTNFEAETGDGMAGDVIVTEGTDTGHVWFTDPQEPHLFLSMLDGTSQNGFYWVFLASLTDWQYTVTVTDTVSASVQTYENPLGQSSSSIDVAAFAAGAFAVAISQPTSEPISEQGAHSQVSPPPTRGGAGSGCVAGSTRACLFGRRFQVEVTRAAPPGLAGARPITDRASFFWLFQPNFLDLGVRIVDGGAVNGNFWVFWGSLATTEFTIDVTDLCTGATWSHTQPNGASTGGADLEALPASTCLLFGDGFESGDLVNW